MAWECAGKAWDAFPAAVERARNRLGGRHGEPSAVPENGSAAVRPDRSVRHRAAPPKNGM
ncbi:hypothetical protein [Streptomyces tsukubensis]|uniref:hypothetical protein n=1 Tax=Streptomyces tsukubensis TaxID=83656 RepID=UPI00344C60DE